MGLAVLSSVLLGACDSGEPERISFAGRLTLDAGQTLVLKSRSGEELALQDGDAVLGFSRERGSDSSFVLDASSGSFDLLLPKSVRSTENLLVFVDPGSSGQGVPLKVSSSDEVVGFRYERKVEPCRTSGYCRQLDEGQASYRSDCPGSQSVGYRIDTVERTVRVEFGTPGSSESGFTRTASFEGKTAFEDRMETGENGVCKASP